MRRVLASLVFALTALPATEARAQSKEDLAHAEALFNAGRALTDAGQFTDACAKFGESKRLAPGLGVTLYLADCYEHIGRSASAWNEFRSAEGLARERNDKRADVARARAQGLEPKLLRITVLVSPSVARTGLQVLRDGVPVAQEELGLPIPVDPGDHVVAVSSAGHKTRTFDAHVGTDRQTATVNVEGFEDEKATAGEPPAPANAPYPAIAPPSANLLHASAAPSTPERPVAKDHGATRRWLGLATGGLGVVGAGVGSFFGLAAMSKRDQSNNGGGCNSMDQCPDPAASLRRQAVNDANVSTIAFVAGGVAIAAGVVLYVTAPREAAGTTVVVAPLPIGGGGGAVVRASF